MSAPDSDCGANGTPEVGNCSALGRCRCWCGSDVAPASELLSECKETLTMPPPAKSFLFFKTQRSLKFE